MPRHSAQKSMHLGVESDSRRIMNIIPVMDASISAFNNNYWRRFPRSLHAFDQEIPVQFLFGKE